MFQNQTAGVLERTAWPLWQRAVLFSLGYFLCALVGSQLSVPGALNVSFWLPAGLFISVLLRNPTRDWLWLALAVLPASVAFELVHQASPDARLIFLFYFANVTRSLVGAWLVRRFVAERPALTTLKEFFGLMALAGIISAMLGGLIGASALTMMGRSQNFFHTWFRWWAGSAMAVLVFAPLLLTWVNPPKGSRPSPLPVAREFEITGLFCGLSLSAWALLVWGGGVNAPKVPLLIFALWSGLRFGVRGAAATVFWMALLMSFLTTHYQKGLSPDDLASGNYILTLQMFLAVAALVALIPPIILAERDRSLERLRESEERFRNLTQAAFEGIVIVQNGRILDVNDQTLKMFGYERMEMVGKAVVELVAAESRAEVAEAVRTGMESIYAHRAVRKDGSVFHVEARARMYRIGNQTLRMTALRDITERKQAEDLTQSQKQVLELIAGGAPMRQTLEALTRTVEAQSPELLASILLLDADGLHVRHGAAPSLPPEYLAAIDGAAIGPNAGSCGTAAFRREPVFVADIASDPLWADYKQLALPHGLNACWSTPIFDARRNVLGTFAIYRRQPGLPDARHRQLIETATHTAAVCITKHHTEAEYEQSVTREHSARLAYTVQLIAAQEAERKRIAAELHDNLGQNLLLIKNLAQMVLREKKPEQTYDQVASIDHLAAQCLAETRQLSGELHPHQLDHLGLKRALEVLLEKTGSASEIKFTWKLDDVGEIFSAAAAMNFYRIVQESLNNILKHSRAKNVRVELARDIHDVSLRIKDDGCGYAAATLAENKMGMGLRNITERVRMLGGTLAMDSAPGQGTRIEVMVPVAAGAG